MKIGIVCAMVKELMPLLKSLGEPEQINVGGYPLYSFSVNGNEIHVVQSGVGEIYASGATATLISLGVEQIYNFGVCGSLSSSAKSCDSIAVSGVVHYDFDLSTIDGVEVGVYPNYKKAVIDTDEILLKKHLAKFPNLKMGVCASADKFLVDEEIKANLNKKYGAICCDMESAGVLLASSVAKIPCFILKTVSDGGGAQEYRKTVYTASEICANIIKEMIF